MVLWIGVFLFGLAVAYSDLEKESLRRVIKIKKEIAKVFFWFIVWSVLYAGIISLNYSGAINNIVHNNTSVAIIEYDKLPLASFSGEFINSEIHVASELFGVQTTLKSKEYFKYLRLYENDTKKFNKLPSDKVFIKEDAKEDMAYLARIKAKPKVFWLKKVWITPPFFVFTFDTKYWVAHVPPGTVKYEFKIE